MSSEFWIARRWLWIAVSLTAVGCGRGGDGLSPVTGTITLDGRPLAEAEVTFLPEVGRPSWGKTDADGRYCLLYTAQEQGAVPGLHRVVVSTHVERDPDSSDPLIQQGRPESVPPQFNIRTTLKVQVQPDQHQTLDFVLQSAVDQSPAG